MSEKTLSNIAKFTGGSGFPEKYQGKTSGEYPFIKVSDMNLPPNKKFIIEANNYVDTELANRLNLQIFEKGTTVFAKVGAAILLNRCRKLVKNTIVDNNMMGATPVNCDEDFLFYVLSSFDFGKLVQTGALPSINQTLFDRLQCIDLPLPGQRKIARILSAVDAVIEKTEAAIAKYKATKSGMMRDLFTRGIDLQTGKLRPRYEEAPELYKESELGWVPREWDVVMIGEMLEQRFIIEHQDGNHGEAYPRANDFTPTGIPFVSAKHIDLNGEIIWEDTPKLPQNYLGRLRIGFGKPGDIVFAHNATVGPVGFVPNDSQQFIASTSTTIYRADNQRLLNKYMFHLLQSDCFQNEIQRIMGQTTRNQAPITAQRLICLTIAPKAEQEQLANRLEAVRRSLKFEYSALNKYQQLKSALMSDLLTGKVRVKYNENEKVEAM